MAEDTTPNPFVEYARTHQRRGMKCWVCIHPQRKLMEDAYRQGVGYRVMVQVLEEQGDPGVSYHKVSSHFGQKHHERAE